MNRRAFLRAVIAVPLVAVALPRVVNPMHGLFNPEANLALQYRNGLMFHRDAFVWMFQPLEIDPKYEIRYGTGHWVKP